MYSPGLCPEEDTQGHHGKIQTTHLDHYSSINQSQTGFGSKGWTECFQNLGGELWSSVWHDLSQDVVQAKHMIHQDVSRLGCCGKFFFRAMKCSDLENLSTSVKMVDFLEETGRPLTKPKAMWDQGWLGMDDWLKPNWRTLSFIFVPCKDGACGRIIPDILI